MASKNSSSKVVSSHAVANPVASTTAAQTPAKAASAAPATPVVAVAAPVAAPVVTAAVATAPAIATKPAIAATAKPAEPARDRSTIVALIAKLSDPEADVARDAAATLATLPADAQAVDALCVVIRNADNYFHPVVRTAAAAALGQLRDRRAVDSLLLATQDTMAEASEEAIKSLGMLGDSKAIPALHAIIRNENSFYLETVRKAATQALARLTP
ncbi:MAG TPA: HEAT repeat domain-containing protein [Phycisphaerae bacterium]|jgi:HEAT repeat protein